MDRGKSGQSSRGGAKSKITQYPPDIFALGSKPSSTRDDSKRSGSSHSKSSSSSSHQSSSKVSSDRKREGSLSSVPPTKKAKVSGIIRAVTATSTASSSASTSERVASSSQSQTSLEHWETIAIECDPKDFALNVIKALDEDLEKAAAYICGAMKTLKTQRYKPDKIIYLSLLFLAKYRPTLFLNDSIVAGLACLLRRDTAHSFKSKGNPAVPVLCASLLLRGHVSVQNWPELFVKLYVEDALGDRIWVDLEECRPFVENIITAFNTRVPPKSLLAPELSGALTGSRDTSSPLTVDDEAREGRNTPEILSTSAHEKEGNTDVPVVPRYSQSYEVVEQIVLEAIKEQLNRRQPPETITRNFLRLLSSACGLVEIRIIAVSRLEMWLHNPKLMRPAQELLAYLCCNCVSVTQRDLEVTAYLTKIRLKTKALINVYLNCLRELLTSHNENLPSMLKHTIYNELSNARNPNNMPMIAVMFQAAPETAANVLAEIFQDLLLNKDDYLRSLRALLREIVRVLRFDINLYALCRSLVKERKEVTAALREFESKDRMFASIADLMCLAMFLGISPQVKEAAVLLSRGDKKEIATLQSYQMLVAKIQKEAVTWLHEVALRLFRPTPQEFMHVLHKVLFLESADQYYKVDMWPSESDRNLLLRLASEVPLLQATLIRILLVGISKDHPLNAPDTLELADQLIKRAAGLPSESYACLQADKLEIIDLIFNLTAYHYPDNISLPQGYNPPQLAISNLYWKGWIMLLMLAAHNPSSFGNQAWKKYPMLRTFMEMCITNHFAYPPPTVAMGEMYEDMKNKELQIAALDKQQILEFESHLAAASTKMTITEQTSLLLSQLIEMSPMGEPRQPPSAVLEQLLALNGTHRMGHLLCRSRNPDFLLEIIQRQGSSQHMPWLADLVHNSEGALSHLPVQCLCEYLLISGMQEKNEKHRKHSQVLTHLQTVLTDITQDYTASYEILEYFLRRLNSLHCASRVQAIKGLKMVLSTVVIEDEPVDMENVLETNDLVDYWLLRQVPNLPHFIGHIRVLMVASLRQACQVETDPVHVSSYINFLAQQTMHDSLTEMLDLVLDMAQLIVERSTIIAAVLPIPEQESKMAYKTLHSLMTMFCSYLSKAKEPRHETISWSESQDHVLITWANGEECTMHILVVHAMIILLTYGPANDHNLFITLLETWFPINSEPPKAYLVDTSEEALLIPDWLKLRMIRSTVPRLVDAALINLEPSQLVLFIQSFGIPVSSMTKLLSNLDSAVTIDQNSVDEAVLDKCYMAQLVEVQHRRGAAGGNIFVQVLQLIEPILPDDDSIEIGNTKEVFPSDVGSIINRNVYFEGNSVMNLMNSLFENVIVDGNKNRVFGNLMRALGQEIHSKIEKPISIISQLIMYFNANLNSKEFITTIISKERYSCTLFRLMLTSKKHLEKLTNLARNIINKIEQKNCSLYEILKQYLNTQNSNKLQNKKVILGGNPVEVLEKTELVSLERTTKQLVEQNLEKSDNTVMVDALSKLILIDVEVKKIERIGLLVDWLAELEMEIIDTSPKLQMGLLFSKHPNMNSDQWMVFRPYLLTLLTHRVSWSSLHACVIRLLADFNPTYDPTSILDFLWALICNPKLWQGRDKFTPKNYKLENVLCLKNEQIKTVVNYILEEAHQINNIPPYKTSDCILKMESRLQLLIQCIGGRTDAIISVVKHLRDCTIPQEIEVMEVITLDDSFSEENVKTKSEIAQEFLLLLYMKLPKIIYFLNANEKKKICKLSHISDYSTSIVDNISHSLFTALAATPRSKDWGRKSHEFDLLARKMAAVHPALILRQLPMIATGLKGRTHLDFSVFKSRNHLTLFTQILGIVELLIPEVFEPTHKDGLERILRSFFSLLKSHGHLKELHLILGRFVSLLQAFMSHDPKRALIYLQQYAHLLYDLHLQYANLRPLRSLMSSISLPKEEGYADNYGETGEVLVAVARPPSPEPLPPNWANLIANIGKLQDEEMTSVLQEIDHISNRRPAILESIVDQLSLLILSPSSSVRQLGHVLLIRYLRHNPISVTMSSPILSSVLRSLESSNTDVVNSALEKLSEIVVCLQEHADHILEKVFLLGVKSNINTFTNITKAISVLNIQSGA